MYGVLRIMRKWLIGMFYLEILINGQGTLKNDYSEEAIVTLFHFLTTKQ